MMSLLGGVWCEYCAALQLSLDDGRREPSPQECGIPWGTVLREATDFRAYFHSEPDNVSDESHPAMWQRRIRGSGFKTKTARATSPRAVPCQSFLISVLQLIRQLEVHQNLRLDLHRFAVQVVRLVLPLPHGFLRGVRQDGIAAYHL